MTEGPGWYERLEHELVHDGYHRLYIDRLRAPDGSEIERELVSTDDVVAVVPLMDDGTVVLLRQYRHPVGRYLLEIPAGKLDVEGEDPADAAQRELAEEIGMRAGSLEPLTTFVNSGGLADEHTTVYVGRGLTEVPRPDDFELTGEEADMEVVRLPFDAALSAVHDGTIVDAKTVVGLLMAAARPLAG